MGECSNNSTYAYLDMVTCSTCASVLDVCVQVHLVTIACTCILVEGWIKGKKCVDMHIPLYSKCSCVVV